MARWEPAARVRLEDAALALYGERGFESTTVAEIAARAGLTERTFFRHFADKREALFGGQGELRERLVSAVEHAPASLDPLDAIALGLEAIAAPFEDRRERVRRRCAIIAANPGLRERELAKLAAWAGALAGALRRRGASEVAAGLAAEVAIAMFRTAFERWVAEEDQDLVALVRGSVRELRALCARGGLGAGRAGVTP